MCCRAATLYYVFILTFVMFLLTYAQSYDKQPEDVFGRDFGNFLHSIGSSAHKYKKMMHYQAPKYATENTRKVVSRNEDESRVPKEVLKDVLMMKLVSYYENKYKISHGQRLTSDIVPSEPTTAQEIIKNKYDPLNDMWPTEKSTSTAYVQAMSRRRDYVNEDMAEVVTI